MPDAHVKVAMRLRYNVPEPNPGGTDTCRNCLPRQGRICGSDCRCDGGAHALVCKLGGAVQQRHDDARDVLFNWLKDMGLHPWREQAVPAWDTPKKKAILDIAYCDPRMGVRYIDIAITAANVHADVPPDIRIQRHERFKRRRYPGPPLIPFVIDIRGAWGKEAIAWIKDLKPFLNTEDKNAAIASLRWRLSASLQSAVADAIIRSTTETRRARDPPQTPPPAAATPPPTGPSSL